MNALDDVDPIKHGSSGAVPLRHDEDVARTEEVNRLFELRAVSNILTARLFPKDVVAPVGA